MTVGTLCSLPSTAVSAPCPGVCQCHAVQRIQSCLGLAALVELHEGCDRAADAAAVTIAVTVAVTAVQHSALNDSAVSSEHPAHICVRVVRWQVGDVQLAVADLVRAGPRYADLDALVAQRRAVQCCYCCC
eukprot:836-Heterococcus_DN1.PRE.1